MGKRWNRDPKGNPWESDYAVLGNSPNINVDPNGDIFFGLFGSTSDQRQSARAYAKDHNGEVEDLLKKSIHVKGTESFTSAMSGDLYVIGYNQYFNKDGTESPRGGTISAYTPGLMTKWRENNGLVARFGYDIANGVWLTAQNLGIRQVMGEADATNLGGGISTPDENVMGLANAASIFLPENKASEGLGYLEKMTCAKFSQIFKGSILTTLSPAVRGGWNRFLNNGVFRVWNSYIPTTKAVQDLAPVLMDQTKSSDSK